MGGGTGVIGERFFSGFVGSLLRLRQDVDQQGTSTEIDRNSGIIPVTEVPESSALLGSLVLLGSGSIWVLRRRQRVRS